VRSYRNRGHEVNMDLEMAALAYCIARQAERSIDRIIPALATFGVDETIGVLQREWDSLLAFYRGPRLNTIEHAVERARNFQGRSSKATRGDITVRAEETARVLSTLASLLLTLNAPIPPRHQDAVDLRMALHQIQSALANSFSDKAQLKKAEFVENYGQPQFLTHYTIAEILGPSDIGSEVGR
jgi:hypothetical protein